MSDNKLTRIGELPENVKRWGNCLLLHKRTSVMTDNGVIFICKICGKEEKK